VFQLHNFPNPFNPVTNIVYSLPEASTLKLNIYNSAGQRVRSLVNEFSPAGVHSVSWNGTNDQDVRVSSGVYFLIIELPSAIYKRKLVLLK
jgi:flagellar hook assembly protein FlgD